MSITAKVSVRLRSKYLCIVSVFGPVRVIEDEQPDVKMNNSTCLLAHELTTSFARRLVTYYCISVSILATGSGILLMKMQKNVFPFHRNLKIVLCIHMFYCFQQSLGFGAVHIADLIRLTKHHDDPCDYLLSAAYVFNLRQVPVIGIYGQILTLACISVERIWASVVENYEKRKLTLGITLLCAGQFVVAVTVFYVFLAVDVDWSSQVALFNVRSDGGAWKFKLIVYFGTVVEILSIIAFHVLLFVNNRRRGRLQRDSLHFVGLSARYQIAENVNAMKLLVPAVWMHFIVFAANGVSLMLYDRFGDKSDKVTSAVFLDACNVSSIYPILMAIFMFAKHPKARRNLLMSGKGQPGGSGVEPQKDEADIHFAYLRAMFLEKPQDGAKCNRTTLKYWCCC
uniref:G protein-coupled receptor n=1 Tax=Steinernema glaseri TaxID=37863 RepID=A0A1I8AUY2_9BILA